MKSLTCEMCGSTNFLKEEGVFVCQSCGTKYSVEEAKKMMNVGGIVTTKKVEVRESAQEVDNYLMMAKSAQLAGNNREAELYCNKTIERSPKNPTAWYIKGNAAGWQSSIANNRFEEAIICFSKALEYTSEEEKTIMKKDIGSATEKLCISLLNLACKHFSKFPNMEKNCDMIELIYYAILAKGGTLIKDCNMDHDLFIRNMTEIVYQGAVNTFKTISTNYYSIYRPNNHEWGKFVVSGGNIVRVLNITTDEHVSDNKSKIKYYKEMIKIEEAIINSHSYFYSDRRWVEWYLPEDQMKSHMNLIRKIQLRIKELDPTYTIPEKPSKKQNGCYVATAVYGSYDCPEVWTLRRFRDNTLAETWYGRAFIHTYYAISPTLVKWFGHTEWFKIMWKEPLDTLVNKLQSQGVENTPYNDKIW